MLSCCCYGEAGSRTSSRRFISNWFRMWKLTWCESVNFIQNMKISDWMVASEMHPGSCSFSVHRLLAALTFYQRLRYFLTQLFVLCLVTNSEAQWAFETLKYCLKTLLEKWRFVNVQRRFTAAELPVGNSELIYPDCSVVSLQTSLRGMIILNGFCWIYWRWRYNRKLCSYKSSPHKLTFVQQSFSRLTNTQRKTLLLQKLKISPTFTFQPPNNPIDRTDSWKLHRSINR